MSKFHKVVAALLAVLLIATTARAQSNGPPSLGSVQIVPAPPPAGVLNPPALTCPAGVPCPINNYDVNGEIDLCGHGFGCNVQWNNNVTINNGATALSATGSLFASTDCNVSHGAGCTGSADKLINIYDGGSQTFGGTIVGFTDANDITISSAYAGANTVVGKIYWGSDDLAVWNALATYLGTAGSYRGAKVWCHSPIMTSATLATNRWSVDFGGPGSNIVFTDNLRNNSRCIFIAGAPGLAGTPLLQVGGNAGSHWHDFQWIGSDLYPPSAAVDIINQVGGGNATSHNNRFDHISDLASTNLAPTSFGLTGSGTATVDMTAAQTSITMNATPTGLQPDAPVYFFDDTGGWEIKYTDPTYVASANPIVLATGKGLAAAHATANTTIRWSANAVAISAFRLDKAQSQDDVQQISNIDAEYVDTAIDARQQQSVENDISQVILTNGANLLAMNNGGVINLRAGESNNSSFLVYQNGGTLMAKDLQYQPASTQPPNGTSMMYLAGANGGYFRCDGCGWPNNGHENSGGDFIMSGPGANALDVDFENLRLLDSTGGLVPPASQQFRIHAYIAGTESLSFKARYMMVSVPPQRTFTYAETGTGNASTIRTVDFQQIAGGQGNAISPHTFNYLRGTQTYNQFRYDDTVPLQAWSVDVPILPAPDQGISPTAVGGGTGTFYCYYVTAVVTNADGTSCETLPSPATTTVQNQQGGGGAGTLGLDGVTYWNTVNDRPIRGATSFNFYRTINSANACLASSSSTFAGSVTNGTSTVPTSGAAPNQVGFVDNGTTTGAAPPTVNTCGQMIAGQLALKGATSGTAVVAVPAAAGTPTLTLETVTGTVPVIQAQATPGASPTAILRMTGGGPGTANQNSWMPITLSDGSTGYVPIWK